MPTPFEDPKGLFLLEAMAAGIPLVQPNCGAFTEIIQKTGGGILVEPGNPHALAQGILDIWEDPELRMKLAERAYHGVRSHYSISQMTQKSFKL